MPLNHFSPNWKNNQLADSIRTWYIFRAKAVKDLLDFDTEDFSSQEFLWFNRRVRSKSKQFFDYQDWYDKGIHTVADLMNVPDSDNVYLKTHEDLVSEFGISQKDKRKSNFLLENIHLRNFKCTIESRLRSFYYKIFHRAIAFRNFLFKIKRIDSPGCCFCQKVPKTITHIFLWMWFCQTSLAGNWYIFHLNTEFDHQLSNFEKVLVIFDNKFLTYIILCTKYFIYRCKFQDKKPHVNGLKSFIKSQREIEYCIAKKKGKLSRHFKKWSFVI